MRSKLVLLLSLLFLNRSLLGAQDSSLELYRAAKQAYKAGNLPHASRQLSQAWQALGANARAGREGLRALVLRGKILGARGHHLSAAATFGKALHRLPTTPGAATAVASIERLLLRVEEMHSSSLGKALLDRGESLSRRNRHAAAWGCFRGADALLRTRAEAGDAQAAVQLATLSLRFPESSPQGSQAASRLLDAAAHGQPPGLLLLADCYRDGRAVPQDRQAALRYYSMAHDLGAPEAESRIVDLESQESAPVRAD